jgi:hypothetical protein
MKLSRVWIGIGVLAVALVAVAMWHEMNRSVAPRATPAVKPASAPAPAPAESPTEPPEMYSDGEELVG